MGKVLLLGAGTQALSIVKGLSKSGLIVYMLYEESNYADASRYVSKRFICDVPPSSDDYLRLVEDIIIKESIDVLIPMGDRTAEFLSRNKGRLGGIAHFIIPDYDSFMKGYDKNSLMKLCSLRGYPHPKTIDLSAIKDLECDDLLHFPYPAILKPNRTTGGRGMRIVSSYEEMIINYLDLREQYGDYHLQRYVKEGGRQVKLQLCVDCNGTLIARSAMLKVRWFPIRGGSSCCAVSMKEEKMTEVCLQILRDINWEGFADFDLIEDPVTNELLVMEINPRLPACIGAAVYAGIDWGRIIVDQALGNAIQQKDYKEGVSLRHLGFDILWFLKSPNRLHTHPSWFHFWGKNVFYQDMGGLTDIKPFFYGTYHNLKKLCDPSFKKSKSI